MIIFQENWNNAKYGCLVLRAYYNSGSIFVEGQTNMIFIAQVVSIFIFIHSFAYFPVLSAKNLMPMDANGWKSLRVFKCLAVMIFLTFLLVNVWVALLSL